MLRLGVAQVLVGSLYIASRYRSQNVSLYSLQAPRMIINRDSVSGVGFCEPTPSVVWQSRSVSVQRLLQWYRRYGGCSKAGTRHTTEHTKRPVYPRGSISSGT
jgi:hypothetical protein